MSVWKSAAVRAVIAPIGSPASCAPRVDLVVDVGDVANVGDARKQPSQKPGQHVEHDDRTGVADMGEVIDGRPAHVHPDVRGVDRDEPLALAGEAVVEMNVGHGRPE